MSLYYDSPLDYCPIVKRFVLLDQTQADCANDMGCLVDECPLELYFPRRKIGTRPRPRRRSRRNAPDPSRCADAD